MQTSTHLRCLTGAFHHFSKSLFHMNRLQPIHHMGSSFRPFFQWHLFRTLSPFWEPLLHTFLSSPLARSQGPTHDTPKFRHKTRIRSRRIHTITRRTTKLKRQKTKDQPCNESLPDPSLICCYWTCIHSERSLSWRCAIAQIPFPSHPLPNNCRTTLLTDPSYPTQSTHNLSPIPGDPLAIFFWQDGTSFPIVAYGFIGRVIVAGMGGEERPWGRDGGDWCGFGWIRVEKLGRWVVKL